MILYLQKTDGRRFFYRLNTKDDFRAVFEAYPRTRYIAMVANGLRDAAERIAQYLSSHHIDAWVEDNEISKGIKDTAVKLGLAAATTWAPMQSRAPIQHSPAHELSPPAVTAPVQDDFGAKPEDSFLWSIMQLESSGGKNLQHRTKGQTHPAMGRWGIKKPTANEMLDRMGRSNVPSHLTPLYDMGYEEAEQYFRHNPQVELDVARAVARHVLNRQKGDIHRAAYAWRHGHNLFPRDIPSSSLKASGYINKFKQYHSSNPYNIPRHLVTKSENKGDFKWRLQQWSKGRAERLRESTLRDHTWNPDPGRVRQDKELEPDTKEWQKRLHHMVDRTESPPAGTGRKT